jgi:hypothetical protein
VQAVVGTTVEVCCSVVVAVFERIVVDSEQIAVVVACGMTEVDFVVVFACILAVDGLLLAFV